MLDPKRARPTRLTGAARRQREYRRRLRDGVMPATFEIDGAGLDWLIHVRALDPKAIEVADLRQVRRAVGAAVTAMIRVSSRS